MSKLATHIKAILVRDSSPRHHQSQGFLKIDEIEFLAKDGILLPEWTGMWGDEKVALTKSGRTYIITEEDFVLIAQIEIAVGKNKPPATRDD